MRHDSTVNWAEFSRDGKWLATASYDKTGRIWDADTGLPVTGPLQHTGNVRRIAFSPDARFVVVGDGERRRELEGLAGRLGLGTRIRFIGWRRDLATIYA